MNDNLAADLASLRIDRSKKGPDRRLRTFFGALLGLGAVGAGVVVVKPYIESRLFKTEVAVTEIISVSPAQADVELTATGYVVPQSTAKVAAKLVGRIRQVNVKEGARVKVGDVLFELEPDDENAAIAAAQARATATTARVATARANNAELELDYQRQKKLAESGAATRAEVDTLAARLKALASQISVAEAESRASVAAVTSLAISAKNLHILAPIDGTAMSKPASVGEVASPAGLLVELADFATLLVEVDVPEGRLGKVKPEAPCEIVLDAFASERFQGQVVDVGPRLNRAKATAVVKVRFLAPPTTLRPEMSARVSFLQKALDEAKLKEPEKLIVPASALVERNGGKAVWVLVDGTIRLTPVKVGEAFGVGFILEAGPAPKTRVVKDPRSDLSDGLAVKEKGAT